MNESMNEQEGELTLYSKGIWPVISYGCVLVKLKGTAVLAKDPK